MARMLEILPQARIRLAIDPAQLADLERRGIVCPACAHVMRPRLRALRIPRLCPGVMPAESFLELLGLCGGIVLSDAMVDALGREAMEREHRSWPIFDAEGRCVPTHNFWIEKQSRGVLRGDPSSHRQLCRSCGRLLYWPLGTTMVLARDLSPCGTCQILSGSLICSREVYTSRIQQRRDTPYAVASGGIGGVYARPVEVAAHAADGLPDDRRALLRALRQQGRFTPAPPTPEEIRLNERRALAVKRLAMRWAAKWTPRH